MFSLTFLPDAFFRWFSPEFLCFLSCVRESLILVSLFADPPQLTFSSCFRSPSHFLRSHLPHASIELKAFFPPAFSSFQMRRRGPELRPPSFGFAPHYGTFQPSIPARGLGTSLVDFVSISFASLLRVLTFVECPSVSERQRAVFPFFPPPCIFFP